MTVLWPADHLLRYDSSVVNPSDLAPQYADVRTASKAIRLSSGTLAYAEAGQGAAPIVFLHGYGDSSYTWRHQLPALADTAHCFAPDFIGYGLSDAPPIAYTPDVFLACIREFMGALEIKRATFVGSSLGAAAALALATHQPELVDQLILLGPTIPGVQPAGHALHAVFWLVHHGRWGRRLLQPQLKPAVRFALRESFADPSRVTDEMVEYYVRLARHPGFKHAYISTAEHWPAWAAHQPRFGQLTMPVLLIWGSDDRVHPIRQSGLLRTLIPQAHMTAIPRCGHLPQCEQPETVNRLVREAVSTSAHGSLSTP